MKLDVLFQSSSRGTFLDSEHVSFDGVPAGSVAVVGLPGATPYRSAGPYCAAAPAAIRAASASYAANRMHYDFDLGSALLPDPAVLVDCGDVPFDPADFAANRTGIRTAYETLLTRKAAPLMIGGDDSVQIPALQAFAAKRDITILQIDAHIDWRDEVQSERFGLSSTMRRASEMTGVKSIVQVGARGMGSARPSDVADARAYGAKIIDMRAVRAKGVGFAAEQVAQDRGVVVCLDVDALDPSVVPGVIGRAPGGLTYGDIVELLHGVAARAPIIGFNLVEFVPGNDVSGLGATVVTRLAMLGVGLLRQGSTAS